MEKTVNSNGDIESIFKKEGGITKVIERKQEFPTILEGKVEIEPRYIVHCTIQKQCNEENCPQGVIQLMRRKPEEGQKPEDCYKYKIFMSQGKYHIKCDQCETDISIKYGSLLRDINFHHSGDKCQD